LRLIIPCFTGTRKPNIFIGQTNFRRSIRKPTEITQLPWVGGESTQGRDLTCARPCPVPCAPTLSLPHPKPLARPELLLPPPPHPARPSAVTRLRLTATTQLLPTLAVARLRPTTTARLLQTPTATARPPPPQLPPRCGVIDPSSSTLAATARPPLPRFSP
jgi:hypothetical protein